MTDEERFERIERRQDISEAWHDEYAAKWAEYMAKLSRAVRNYRVLMAALVIFAVFTIGWTIQRSHDAATQRCVDRAEAREAVRDLVELALQDTKSTTPVVVRLENALKPGGALEQIQC